MIKKVVIIFIILIMVVLFLPIRHGATIFDELYYTGKKRVLTIMKKRQSDKIEEELDAEMKKLGGKKTTLEEYIKESGNYNSNKNGK